jgi:CrcB protein
MKQILLVFLGGGLGSALRYLIGKQLNGGTSGLPLGTLTVNVVGCLVIGLLMGMALKNNSISENSLLFLATGLCGGFTTFSAFAYENAVFLKSGDVFSFALYTFGSLLLGFGAVFIGIWIVRLF